MWIARVVVLAVAVTLVVAIFWHTITTIAAIWRFDTFSHGFLVVPVTAYLVWIRRSQLPGLSPATNYWALPLLAMLGFGWLLGNAADVKVVQEFAVVAMVPALVWLIFGTQTVRALIFPILFLFFAVPAGDSLIGLLQDFTGYFVTKALELSRVPVYTEGRLLVLSSGTWQVTEACSGIRYVISAVMLGTLYASLMYHAWRRRAAFLFAAIATPVVANGLRAYVIIIIGHLSNRRIAVGIDHIIFGWVFFLFVIFILFAAGLRWRQRSTAEPTPVGPPPATSSGSRGSLASPILAATTAILLVAAAPVYARYLAQPRAETGRMARLPTVTAPWQRLDSYAGGWVPYFPGADQELMQSYTSGSQQVHFYLALYQRQMPGAQVASSANHMSDAQWVEIGNGSERVAVPGAPEYLEQTLLGSRRGGRRLVWSWYWVGGGFTASRYRAKLLEAEARLLGKPEAAAVIVLAADYEASPAEAASAMRSFLEHASIAAALQ